MKTNRWMILVIMLMMGLLLAACGGGDDGAGETLDDAGDDGGRTSYSSGDDPADEEPAADDGGSYYEADAEEPAADSPPSSSGPNTPPATGNNCCEEKDPYRIPPSDNYFQGYGVNTFITTKDDPLSTFSIDVDTASYTVSRRYLRDGFLPPADAVRTEEFVNFFEQGYPNPEGTAFGIYADGAPSPFDGRESHIIRIGIQGYEVSNSERKPANLVFVIDTSGSMGQGNRLELVKRSLIMLVDRLGNKDTVSIVEFGSYAREVLPPTSGNNKSTIRRAINQLQPNGSTNAEAGLQIGYELALDNFKARGINRVILCSDGVANVGMSTANGLLTIADGYAKVGITLSTMGFGMGNFNDELMEQLADKGNGTYAYIDDIGEAERLFVDNLTATLQTIAFNAKVQVDFNPEVVAQYRLIGYENREIADSDFRNDDVDAGEIGAGHTVTALYSVDLYQGAFGRIATVHFRWEDPDSRAIKEIAGDFHTTDLADSFEEANPYFQLAVMVSQYAEILRHSPWAVESSLESLISHAYRLASAFVTDPDVAEFATLVSQASGLR